MDANNDDPGGGGVGDRFGCVLIYRTSRIGWRRAREDIEVTGGFV